MDTAATLRDTAENEPQRNVRQRLVEVAAKHFAAHGFQGASQRAIQREVGVNNSTANYYFGSKEALYCGVLDSALGRIQRGRLDGLERVCNSAPGKTELDAILTAYLEPHLRETTTDLGYNYARILAGLHLVVPDVAVKIIQERVTSVREVYVDALSKLFPDASRNRIYHVLRYAVGLMAIAPFETGQTRMTDAAVTTMVEEIVVISALAFERLCGSQLSACSP